MQITMLRNPSFLLGCDLTEGKTGEVNDDLAERLIGMGLAVKSAEAPKTIKAVPPAVAIADPVPQTIAGDESTQTTPPKSKGKNQ